MQMQYHVYNILYYIGKRTRDYNIFAIRFPLCNPTHRPILPVRLSHCKGPARKIAISCNNNNNSSNNIVMISFRGVYSLLYNAIVHNGCLHVNFVTIKTPDGLNLRRVPTHTHTRIYIVI